MQIVIAPNAFKNSLPAAEVAEAISKGLQQSKLNCNMICFPVGDGGDGTAELLIRHLNGKSIPVTVEDPLGRLITSSFGITTDGTTAIIEMADASGLRLLTINEYDPLHANSYGTGQLIQAALNAGVQKIIMCIGGSATIDAGTGIMQALGATFCDRQGKELKYLPALKELCGINLQNLDSRLFTTTIDVLCDVENTLLGPDGAAPVFGPQKGASVADIYELETALTKLCSIVFDETGKEMSLLQYGGAAGGVAAGLHTFLNAKLVHGIDHFLNITGFDEVLRKADLVITGEGSIDIQTLQGKGPFGVALKAKQYKLPVIGIAGKVPLVTDKALQQYFDVLLPLSNEAASLETAIQHTYENLVRTSRSLGDLLAITIIR